MREKLAYAADELRRNGGRRTWWTDRFVTRVLGPLQSRFEDSAFRVLEEDWDTLIVLDGCRTDLFEEVADIDRYDEYGTRESAGSATNEWIRANFSGPALSDVVYVNGNPVVSREIRTAFGRFVEPWRDGFDPDIGTVPPEPVTESALDAHERDPEKRLIVHYLQPHYPFVERPDLRYTTFGDTAELDVQADNQGARDVWEAVGEGLVDRETAWEAYGDNLELVLEAIEPLLDARPGRTVITSDHGNLVGERLPFFPFPVYGHPPNVHHPMLRGVPWAVLDDETHREADEDESVSVEEQLESLGYV